MSGLTKGGRRHTIERSPVAPDPALSVCARAGDPPGRALAGHSGGAYQGEDMAKALFGHVGSAPDRRLLDEVTQLRAKVRTLEFEVARPRAENDRLAAAAAEVDLLRLPEPALA